MKTPGVHFPLPFAVALALLVSVSTKGEPPPSAAESGNSNKRSKPQVIYHLPRSSSYGATLHSQAKTERDLPVERPTPSRVPVPEAQQAPERAIAEPPRNQVAPQPKQTVKRPHSKAAPQRAVSPGRGKGHGNSHGGGHGKKK